LHQLSEQWLGSFLNDLMKLDLWWVSIANGDQKTLLADLLGFEHQVALDFFCSACLLKSDEINCFQVLYEECELLIVQERLQVIMEMVNHSRISRSIYFLYIMEKRDTFHITQLPNLTATSHGQRRVLRLLGTRKLVVHSYLYENQARWMIFLKGEPLSLHFY
jgi:hypothetical protein